jgi:hypothetical protein
MNLVVLGKPDLGFAKPIFDLVDNSHLSSLVQAGVSPCVWEEKLLHDKGSRSESILTVTSAATQGQELLFDFLGNFVHTLYILCMYNVYFLTVCFAQKMCVS